MYNCLNSIHVYMYIIICNCNYDPFIHCDTVYMYITCISIFYVYLHFLLFLFPLGNMIIIKTLSPSPTRSVFQP